MSVRPVGYVQTAVSILALSCACAALADRAVEPQQAAASLAAELFVPPVDDPGLMCAGGYQLHNNKPIENADTDLRVAADSLAGDLDQQITLSGSVELRQRELLITSPQVELEVGGVLRFSQGLQLQQPGVIMRGREARWQRAALNQGNAESGDVLEIANAEVVLAENGLRATAEKLARNADGQLLIDGGEFTYCAPGDDGWALSAQQLSLEAQTNQVITRGAVLRIKSVPVLYLPYLKLPMSAGDAAKTPRQSGFLFPELGYGDEDGLSLGVPYYLNLAPNFDATVQPKLVSNRGTGLAAQLRWMTARQSSQVQGSFLANDDIYNGFMSRRRYDQFGGFEQFGAFQPANRWFGNFRHEGHFGAFSTFADYSKLSDRDYLRDLGADFDLARDQSFDSTNPMDLQRRADLYFQQNDLAIKLWHQSFQRLDQLALPTYSRSPQLDLTYQRRLSRFWNVRALGSWVQFKRTADDFFAPFPEQIQQLEPNQGLYGERLHMQPELSYQRRWPGAFVAGAGGFKYTQYSLQQDILAAESWVGDSSPNRQVGYFHVDAGLYFDREFQSGSRSWLHTLEPRALYLRQGYSDQSALPLFDTTTMLLGYNQLFRKERFVGLDRVGDANQLTLGISTRLLSAQSGQEFGSYSLGKTFYAQKHRVGLRGNLLPRESPSSSVLASELSLRFGSRWQLESQQIWHDETSRWQELGAALYYRADQRRLLSVGARKRLESVEYPDEALEQVEFSAIWPVSKQISLMGRWHYDVQRSRTVEGFVGMQYDDCCIRVRFLLTQALRSSAYLPLSVAGNADYALRSNQGIAVEFALKGLGAFGSNIDRMLRRGVRGYDQGDLAR
ncbi:MAG: LPS assembly protein LptD [Pseudomonadota bacterium]|nr:LPS assembly protein LptD [Pseudomonadota bacterium]